jgi:tetratricopeptide (TPR) repeat protein
MGTIYINMNDVANARKAFQNAMAISPGNPDAQFGMAELSAMSGDTATLATTMQKLSAGVDPKTVSSWDSALAIELINASVNGKTYWPDAETYATQGTTLDAGNGEAWYALGYSQAQQRDKKDQASTALLKAYDIFKAQNRPDMLKTIDDLYKQLNGSDISGYAGK